MLAMPKISFYLGEAKISQILHDIKVAEGKIEEYLIQYEIFPDAWEERTSSDLISIVNKGKLYESSGLAEFVENDNYVIIDKLFINREFNSKLNGNFYANSNGKIYYEHNKAGKSKPKQDPFTEGDIDNLIAEGWIPVASASELQ